MLPVINTESWSERYRGKAIEVSTKRLLLTNFHGTEQEEDLSEPANCGGFGRIRHFRLGDDLKWVRNPLPIEPARRALHLPAEPEIRAQVFQNAVCNWRCWYCYVPFNLLNANRRHADWLTPSEIVDLYLADPFPAPMIDLSGGQPDLTPEWIPWMLDELNSRGLGEKVYLWSDDNISNDYFWRYLSASDIVTIKHSSHYGRVGCFKGIDPESFQFNTGADAKFFDEQFGVFKRFLELNLDLYAYVTLTTPDRAFLELRLKNFIDKLQSLHPLLPLRTVPLEIVPFTPVEGRIQNEQSEAMKIQHDVLALWRGELDRRFPASLRRGSICDVKLLM